MAIVRRQGFKEKGFHPKPEKKMTHINFFQVLLSH